MSKPLIYVSGAISGLSMAAVVDKFSNAEYFLKQKGYEVINPIKLDHSANTEQEWSEYMRTDLKALLDCGSIAMLPCWSNSQGARIEFQLAVSLGFNVLFLEGLS